MSVADAWQAVAVRRHLLHPGRLLAVGVLAATAGGAAALAGGWAQSDGGRPLSLVDVVFTAASAVCGTGFAAADVAGDFSPAGHVTLAVLMEVGLVMMMVMGSLVAVAAGSASSDHHALVVRRWLGDTPGDTAMRLPRIIGFAVALVVGLQGATMLAIHWLKPAGSSWAQSAFTAISAMSNTGWSLGGERSGFNLWTGHLALLPPIVIGGLGLPVLMNLYDMVRYRLWRRGQALPGAMRPTLHTKLVLTTTVALYVLGTGALWVSQSQHERGLGTASFLAAARTTAFDTAGAGQLPTAGKFALLPLMLIGGSPGSACGGVKTLTLAILVLATVTTLRRDRPMEAFGRQLPDTLVRIAGGLVVVTAATVGATVVTLLWLGAGPMDAVLFDVTSAVANSGLSMGVVERLTPAGKAVMIAAMFAGRIGPLWLLSVVARRRAQDGRYALPSEPVGLG